MTTIYKIKDHEAIELTRKAKDALERIYLGKWYYNVGQTNAALRKRGLVEPRFIGEYCVQPYVVTR